MDVAPEGSGTSHVTLLMLQATARDELIRHKGSFGLVPTTIVEFEKQNELNLKSESIRFTIPNASICLDFLFIEISGILMFVIVSKVQQRDETSSNITRYDKNLRQEVSILGCPAVQILLASKV